MPHPESRRSWRFHPFELAVGGYKNTGKTTLIEGLMRELSPRLSLAYLKHDAHQFTMDHPGKDTDRIRRAGAASVTIASAEDWAQLGQTDPAAQTAPYAFLNADALLIEGYKDADLPRLVVLDPDLAILQDPAYQEKPPLAVVHPFGGDDARVATGRTKAGPRFAELPWFDRNDLPGIATFVRTTWSATVPPLKGLVLAGGRSTRMGTDKASLNYHGESQLAYAVATLGEFCSEVLVSCRSDQLDDPTRQGFQLLPDRFLDLGPTSGIVTALANGNAAWLVLACDLPLMDRTTIKQLVEARNPFRFATAFQGSDDFPEPLGAIWEPKAYPRLLQFLGMGYDCPRKCLINSPITLVSAANRAALDNANEPADRERILDVIGSRS